MYFSMHGLPVYCISICYSFIPLCSTNQQTLVVGRVTVEAFVFLQEYFNGASAWFCFCYMLWPETSYTMNCNSPGICSDVQSAQTSSTVNCNSSRTCSVVHSSQTLLKLQKIMSAEILISKLYRVSKFSTLQLLDFRIQLQWTLWLSSLIPSLAKI
jgi:hypothetical protein